LWWALETLDKNPGISAVLDLRTLQPLDTEAIFKSVKKKQERPLFIRKIPYLAELQVIFLLLIMEKIL
jgi:pyruvate/2-oxoglutarate/acetoin dehydrogenase E1 component